MCYIGDTNMYWLSQNMCYMWPDSRCNGCELHFPCQGCGKDFCVECIATWNNVLTKCSDNHELRYECCYIDCSRDWAEACSGCCKILAAFSLPNLRKENENLCSENHHLHTENKELRERLNWYGVWVGLYRYNYSHTDIWHLSSTGIFKVCHYIPYYIHTGTTKKVMNS